MSYFAAIQALATTGAFTSRAFLPAFLVALLARYPALVNWLPLVPERPVVLSERLAWLTSDPALALLAVLAVAESWASANDDVREVIDRLLPWLRALAAIVIAFALVDAESAGVLRTLAGAPGLALLPDAGPALPAFVALAVGALVLLASNLRARLLAPLHEADGGGGASRFLSRVEDGWAAGGILLAIVAPVLALILALISLALAVIIDRHFEARAERLRVPCAACGHDLRAAALACPACGAQRTATAAATSALWPDRWWDLLSGANAEAHGLDLLSLSRCPACAEKRPARELLLATPHACGWPLRAGMLDLPGQDAPARLSAHLWRRTLRLALPVALLGLLPVLGAVAALVLSRLRIAQPARRFLPAGARLRARWLSRAAIALLLLASGIPLASAAAAVLILLVQAVVHLRALQRVAEARPAG